MRIPAFVLLATLGTACAIPARDNTHDPAVQPEAVLTVYVSSTSGSIEGTRNTTFTLDASGSTDPKGRTLHYSWDIDDNADFEIEDTAVACDNGEIACLRRQLTVPPLFPANGIGSAPRTVRVKVSAGGAKSTAEAVAILVNQAPVIELEEDLFVLERVQPTVVLDPCALASPCSSADLDGDPIDFDWTQVAGLGSPVVLTTALDGTASFVAPPDPQELVFELAANDGLATTVARLRVRVGTQVWVGTEDPVGLYRLHPDFVTRKATSAPAQAEITAIAADATSGALWFGEYDLNGNAFLRRAGASLEVEATYAAPGLVGGISAAGGIACVAFRDDLNSQTIVQHYDANGAVGPAAMIPGYPYGAFPGPTAGTTWVVSSNSFHLVTTAGVATQVVPDDPVFNLRLVAGDAVDGSLWIFHEGDDASRLKHLFADGTTDVILNPFESFTNPDALVAHPDGGVWAHQGSTLKRVAPDLSIVEEPYVLLLAPPGSPGYSLQGSLATDPIRREVWIAEKAAQRLARYDLGEDGFLHRADDLLLPPNLESLVNTTLVTLVIDERGGRVFAIGKTEETPTVFTDFLAAIPRHLRRIEAVPVQGGSAAFVSADPARGAGWVSPYESFANFINDVTPAVRVATSGRTLAVTPSGPHVGEVAGLRDGGAWIAGYEGTSGRLLRVDGKGSILDTLDIVDLSPNLGVWGAAIFKMSMSEDETTVCATSQRPFSIEGYGPVLRANLQTGAVDLDGGGLGTTYGGDVENAGNGVCWILDSGNYDSATDTCITPSPNGFVARLEGTTIVTTPTNGGLVFTCPRALALDPRDGSAWVSDLDIPTGRNKIFRLDEGTLATEASWETSGTSLSLIDVQRLCADGADASCADIWHISNSPTDRTVHRSRAGGAPALEELERYTLPAGHGVSLDVAP